MQGETESLSLFCNKTEGSCIIPVKGVLMMRKKILPLALLVLATAVLSYFAATWKSDRAHVYPDLTAFNSSTAKRRACYVSAEEAESLTTRALVETVVTYPYLIDAYAFDSPDLWFRGARQNLPMLKELCARPDGLEVLQEQAAKTENDLRLQMGYKLLIGCLERDAQK